MRRALIVGIDDYEWSPLTASINDANAMTGCLEKHENGMPNFDCKKWISSEKKITKTFLKKQLTLLFSNEADVALFYFSGHGTQTDLGSYLVTQDATKFDEGVSLNDIIIMANQSKAHEVVIILDCCHSGHAGNNPFSDENIVMLREGVSILTSSRHHQVSKAKRNGYGALTRIICQALDGSASDLLGEVNISAIYNYADKVLSSWQQRPVFKSHVSTMVPLRTVRPHIQLEKLRMLSTYFEKSNSEIKLSPEYEPTEKPANPEKEKVFSHLQSFTSAGLVKPIGEEHMYFAALNKKPCKLTPLGQFYWDLARNNRL